MIHHYLKLFIANTKNTKNKVDNIEKRLNGYTSIDAYDNMIMNGSWGWGARIIPLIMLNVGKK